MSRQAIRQGCLPEGIVRLRDQLKACLPPGNDTTKEPGKEEGPTIPGGGSELAERIKTIKAVNTVEERIAVER